MVERIEWNGNKYRRYPESKRRSDRVYFHRSIKNGMVALHRDIWEYHNGPIPPDYHVHHIDGNPLNNDISNLACLSAADHVAQHPWTEERKIEQAKHLGRIRHLTKAWHRSPDGLAKHREIGAMAQAAFVAIPKACKRCGKEFLPHKMGNQDKFCSNVCKSSYRRAAGLDDVEIKCKQCGKWFKANKYRKPNTCSRSCANRYRSRRSLNGCMI